ncbi:hypothetical protein D3C80_2047300 [compost metagenome]
MVTFKAEIERFAEMGKVIEACQRSNFRDAPVRAPQHLLGFLDTGQGQIFAEAKAGKLLEGSA